MMCRIINTMPDRCGRLGHLRHFRSWLVKSRKWNHACLWSRAQSCHLSQALSATSSQAQSATSIWHSIDNLAPGRVVCHAPIEILASIDQNCFLSSQIIFLSQFLFQKIKYFLENIKSSLKSISGLFKQ